MQYRHLWPETVRALTQGPTGCVDARDALPIRNRGSLHADVFEAPGSEIAEKNTFPVCPVTGKELKKRDRSEQGARRLEASTGAAVLGNRCRHGLAWKGVD